MGKTRRVDNREFEDYQNSRKSKYTRGNKKRSGVAEPYFDPDLEPDEDHRWVKEYEELNPEDKDS